jgi:hypothetical protein
MQINNISRVIFARVPKNHKGKITEKHSLRNKIRNTNRSEKSLRKLPVGKNQYLAAGFKEL